MCDKAAPVIGTCVAGLVLRSDIATHVAESLMQRKFQGVIELEIHLILALDTDGVAKAETKRG